MMRSKKVRMVLRRCRMVMVASLLAFLPGRAASQRLKSSMCTRAMSATATHSGSVPVTRWAKSRNVSSASASVLGTGRHLELVQVGGHCGHHERCPGGELGPCYLGRPAAASPGRGGSW
jgi:hypothetical protein